MGKFIVNVKARYYIYADDIEEALEMVRESLVEQSVDATYESEEVEKFPFEV